MSYNKPEKYGQEGEGPVRLAKSLPRTTTDKYLTENPQDPHHPDEPQSCRPRESVHRAPRACEDEEPPR